MQSPDHLARVDIDRLLQNGRWSVHVCRADDRRVSRDMVLREVEVAAGLRTASCLRDIDGMAFGETEANRGGATLLRTEIRFINPLVKQSTVMTLHRSSADDAVLASGSERSTLGN